MIYPKFLSLKASEHAEIVGTEIHALAEKICNELDLNNLPLKWPRLQRRETRSSRTPETSLAFVTPLARRTPSAPREIAVATS